MKKKKIVERIIGKDNLKSRSEYFKQYSILNFLLKEFPDPNFWSVTTFEQDISSLYFFRTQHGHKVLKNKYKEFKFKPKHEKPPEIFDKIFGKSKILNKTTKSIRQFLK